MLYFMCANCGYLLKLKVGEKPPHKCPTCGQVCAFLNVTSYRPEHGLGNPDARVMASLMSKAQASKKENAPRAKGLLHSYHIDTLCREAAMIALQETLEQKKKAGQLRTRELITT